MSDIIINSDFNSYENSTILFGEKPDEFSKKIIELLIILVVNHIPNKKINKEIIDNIFKNIETKLNKSITHMNGGNPSSSISNFILFSLLFLNIFSNASNIVTIDSMLPKSNPSYTNPDIAPPITMRNHFGRFCAYISMLNSINSDKHSAYLDFYQKEMFKNNFEGMFTPYNIKNKIENNVGLDIYNGDIKISENLIKNTKAIIIKTDISNTATVHEYIKSNILQQIIPTSSNEDDIFLSFLAIPGHAETLMVRKKGNDYFYGIMETDNIGELYSNQMTYPTFGPSKSLFIVEDGFFSSKEMIEFTNSFYHNIIKINKNPIKYVTEMINGEDGKGNSEFVFELDERPTISKYGIVPVYNSDSVTSSKFSKLVKMYEEFVSNKKSFLPVSYKTSSQNDLPPTYFEELTVEQLITNLNQINNYDSGQIKLIPAIVIYQVYDELKSLFPNLNTAQKSVFITKFGEHRKYLRETEQSGGNDCDSSSELMGGRTLIQILKIWNNENVNNDTNNYDIIIRKIGAYFDDISFVEDENYIIEKTNINKDDQNEYISNFLNLFCINDKTNTNTNSKIIKDINDLFTNKTNTKKLLDDSFLNITPINITYGDITELPILKKDNFTNILIFIFMFSSFIITFLNFKGGSTVKRRKISKRKNKKTQQKKSKRKNKKIFRKTFKKNTK